MAMVTCWPGPTWASRLPYSALASAIWCMADNKRQTVKPITVSAGTTTRRAHRVRKQAAMRVAQVIKTTTLRTSPVKPFSL